MSLREDSIAAFKARVEEDRLSSEVKERENRERRQSLTLRRASQVFGDISITYLGAGQFQIEDMVFSARDDDYRWPRLQLGTCTDCGLPIWSPEIYRLHDLGQYLNDHNPPTNHEGSCIDEEERARRSMVRNPEPHQIYSAYRIGDRMSTPNGQYFGHITGFEVTWERDGTVELVHHHPDILPDPPPPDPEPPKKPIDRLVDTLVEVLREREVFVNMEV